MLSQHAMHLTCPPLAHLEQSRAWLGALERAKAARPLRFWAKKGGGCSMSNRTSSTLCVIMCVIYIYIIYISANSFKDAQIDHKD